MLSWWPIGWLYFPETRSFPGYSGKKESSKWAWASWEVNETIRKIHVLWEFNFKIAGVLTCLHFCSQWRQDEGEELWKHTGNCQVTTWNTLEELSQMVCDGLVSYYLQFLSAFSLNYSTLIKMQVVIKCKTSFEVFCWWLSRSQMAKLQSRLNRGKTWTELLTLNVLEMYLLCCWAMC